MKILPSSCVIVVIKMEPEQKSQILYMKKQKVKLKKEFQYTIKIK